MLHKPTRCICRLNRFHRNVLTHQHTIEVHMMLNAIAENKQKKKAISSHFEINRTTKQCGPLFLNLVCLCYFPVYQMNHMLLLSPILSLLLCAHARQTLRCDFQCGLISVQLTDSEDFGNKSCEYSNV